jgi:hypothetical protein
MIKIQNSGVKLNASTKIGSDAGEPTPVVGRYFYSPHHDYDRDKWWNILSWWSDASHTIQATELPTSSSDVIILPSVAPVVDLDRQDWVQPNTINSGSTGISFTSQLGGNVSCDITGNTTFNGNSTFNK